MSTGAALRGAFRSCSASIASSSRSRLAHRDLFGARLSPVALGKRPEVWTSQRRNLSWLPWKGEAAPKTESPLDPVASAAQQPSTSSSELLQDPSSLPAEAPSSLPLDSTSNGTSTSSLETSSIPDPSIADTVTHINPGNTLSEVIAANSHLPLKDILTSPEAVQAQASTADLASVGLGHGWYSISGWATDLLVGFHSFTGLPWWANIIAVNIIMRLFLVQMLIPSIKHNARWAASMPEQQALHTKIQTAAKAGNKDQQIAASLELRGVWQKYDVSIGRMFRMPAVQMATFFTFFLAIRSLAKTPWPQFLTGGFGWVEDLSIPDPYYILPVTSLICTVAVIRTGADGNVRQPVQSDPKSMGKHMKNILTMLSPMFIIGASQFPAAVTLFWTVSNAYSLLQAHVLKSRPIKRLIGSEHFEGKKQEEPTLRESFDAVLDWATGRRRDIDRQLQQRGYVSGQTKGGAQPNGVETIIESPKRSRISAPPKAKAAPPPPKAKVAPKAGKTTRER